MVPFHPAVGGVALAAALGLQACSSDTSPMRDSLVSTSAQVPPAPEFIARSRPEKLDYIPVGTPAPDRAVQPRSPADIAAAEAEMEALRARNEAQGAATRRAAGSAPSAQSNAAGNPGALNRR